MLPATGVQHARHHVQQHRGGRVDVVARRPPRRGAASALPRRTRPSRSPCWQPPRARARVSADRPSHSARPGRPPDGRARVRSRARRALTGNLDARDTRPRGRVGRSPGRARLPRRGAARRRRIAETTSRRSRDSAARLPAAHCPSRSASLDSSADRRIEQVHLLDDFRELTAAPRQRQPQGRDGHREATTASRRSALDVGLGQRQLSRLPPPAVPGSAQLPREPAPGRDDRLMRPSGNARSTAAIVPACPSSTQLNEWSATSRAASGQSPAASVCRTASTTSP